MIQLGPQPEINKPEENYTPILNELWEIEYELTLANITHHGSYIHPNKPFADKAEKNTESRTSTFRYAYIDVDSYRFTNAYSYPDIYCYANINTDANVYSYPYTNSDIDIHSYACSG